MKPVQNQGGIGTPVFYGIYIGLGHITGGSYDLLTLIITEFLFKEPIYGLSALALSYPYYP
jgi:hypothetical protein